MREKRQLTTRKRAAWTATLAAVLALACHYVPPNYQAACHVLATICGGSR